MKIGIMTINDFDFHPNGRIREAANQQGHEVILMNPYNFPCGIRNNRFTFPDLEGNTMFDVVMPRQGALIGDYGLALIRQFRDMGVPVINDVRGIRVTRDQYLTLQALAKAGVPVPDSFFITTPRGFHRAVAELGGFPVVAKQVNSWGGRGIVLVENEPLVNYICEHVLEERKGMVIQRFIPPEGRRDLRVLVIGQEVAGTMALKPKPGDFRANVHLNGTPTSVAISAKLTDLAIRSTTACGLDIAGVDIIVDAQDNAVVIEVNHAPGFKGLEAATGSDIATKIVNYAVYRYSLAKKQDHRMTEVTTHQVSGE